MTEFRGTGNANGAVVGDDGPDDMDARIHAVVERARAQGTARAPTPVTVTRIEEPPAAEREDVQVARWRRDAIFEWLYAEGPKTIAAVKDHFDLTQSVARADIDQLRVEGRLERTGRELPGPRGGRSSVEFRAVVHDARADDLESEPGPDREPAAPAAMTVHEQLVVRYISCLIGWIERSSIVRDQGPPEHVYDRIERLLEIAAGAKG
jgi:hypothetical protein